ncbi:unnamed protein product [Amaranthus hypochondriacus]
MVNPHEKTSQIKLISQSFIKPKYEIEATKQPYYLNPIDLMLLSCQTMQKGHLFNTKPQNIKSHFLENLKTSLSYALVHFYPLCGKLVTKKFYDDHEIGIYVDCINGPGARIIHAMVDLTVSDILSSIDVHPIVSSFFDLGDEKVVNHDGHTRPLLSIQVTELLDGVFIGFMVNHSVADGTSLWHFISTLSNIVQNFDKDDPNNISLKPIYDHENLYLGLPKNYGPLFKLPYLEPEEFVARFDPGPLRVRIFHFPSKAILLLKNKANKEANVNYISSFQALMGFIWKSITCARNLNPNLDTTFSMVMNMRQRLSPSLSAAYFGNYIGPGQKSCNVHELMENDLGWAALFVNNIVKTNNDKAFREFLINLLKDPYVSQTGAESAFYNPNSVLVAGSAKFDMYGPEFGLGKAVAVLAGYASKDDGKITVNPGRDGEGSIDLEVCLKPETMNALEADENFMMFTTK